MKAALRDSSFYARQAHDTGSSKYHAIVERDTQRGRGPACGYPFHDESTEQDATATPVDERCGRAGCRAAFAKADAAPVTLATVKPPRNCRTKLREEP